MKCIFRNTGPYSKSTTRGRPPYTLLLPLAQMQMLVPQKEEVVVLRGISPGRLSLTPPNPGEQQKRTSTDQFRDKRNMQTSPEKKSRCKSRCSN